jgi:hypothetical protein
LSNLYRLSPAETTLLDSLFDPNLQEVLRDIRQCDYHKLREGMTKEKAMVMEGVLGLPLPPPKKLAWHRQSSHYTIDDVFNEMVGRMEECPQLCSMDIDKVMVKFEYAVQGPAAPQ